MNFLYKIIVFYLFNMSLLRCFRTLRNNNRIKLNMYNSQYIISNNNKKIFGDDEKENFFMENEFIKNKKIISISPGGFKGVYMLGICMYIKDKFDLSPFIFSGASAGAWNSLMLTCKKDVKLLKNEIVDYSIKHSKTIIELENLMKKRIMEFYTTDDFDLQRLFIGVTAFNGIYPDTNIYSGFHNLEDAIDCCIASSHIPLISGGIINRYHNKFTFDGGFSRYPYLNISKNVLHITPSIWEQKKERKNALGDITEFTTLFSKNKYDFIELYNRGYNDAKTNHDYLQQIFTAA